MFKFALRPSSNPQLLLFLASPPSPLLSTIDKQLLRRFSSGSLHLFVSDLLTPHAPSVSQHHTTGTGALEPGAPAEETIFLLFSLLHSSSPEPGALEPGAPAEDSIVLSFSLLDTSQLEPGAPKASIVFDLQPGAGQESENHPPPNAAPGDMFIKLYAP